jgi:uncharacterized protein involved in response to NO
MLHCAPDCLDQRRFLNQPVELHKGIPAADGTCASELWPALPPMAGLHALTTGAVGTTIMSVIARTALSRTGRRMKSGQGALPFTLITLAACLRVAAPFFSALYLPLIAIAGLAWISAFAALVVLCAGALWTRQVTRTAKH